MSGLFREGMSGNAVQKIMSDYGIGKRRETVQAVRRKVLDMMKKEELWLKASPEKLPTKGYFNEADYSAPFQYWIHYNVTGIDIESGDEKTFTLSAFADSIDTPAEWSDYILSQLNPDYYQNIMGFKNVVIRSVDHKAGQPY